METKNNIISEDSIQVIPDEFARHEERVNQAIKGGSMQEVREAIVRRNQFRDQFSPPTVHKEGPAIIRNGLLRVNGTEQAVVGAERL